MLRPLAVTPGVTHSGAYHRPSDAIFLKSRGSKDIKYDIQTRPDHSLQGIALGWPGDIVTLPDRFVTAATVNKHSVAWGLPLYFNIAHISLTGENLCDTFLPL